MSRPALGMLQEAYSRYYSGPNVSDSPEKSRLLIAQRVADFAIDHALDSPAILDIGAGKQSVERLVRMLGNSANGQGRFAPLTDALKGAKFITMDIAAIPHRKQRIDWAQHMLGNMAMLPIRDASVDLVVSNLALDMLRRDEAQFVDVLQGVSNIVRPGGSALFNFHHSTLFPLLCDYYRGQNWPQAEFYDAGENNPYYENPDDIELELRVAGFKSSVNLQEDGKDVWWEIEARKV